MYAPVETISYRESIVTRINWQEKKCPDRRISDVSLCALIGREIPFGQKNFHVSGERRFSLFLKIQLAFDCTRATLGAWGWSEIAYRNWIWNEDGTVSFNPRTTRLTTFFIKFFFVCLRSDILQILRALLTLVSKLIDDNRWWAVSRYNANFRTCTRNIFTKCECFRQAVDNPRQVWLSLRVNVIIPRQDQDRVSRYRSARRLNFLLNDKTVHCNIFSRTDMRVTNSITLRKDGRWILTYIYMYVYICIEVQSVNPVLVCKMCDSFNHGITRPLWSKSWYVVRPKFISKNYSRNHSSRFTMSPPRCVHLFHWAALSVESLLLFYCVYISKTLVLFYLEGGGIKRSHTGRMMKDRNVESRRKLSNGDRRARTVMEEDSFLSKVVKPCSTRTIA